MVKKVLLVEDDELNAPMIAELLGSYGYEVIVAVDGYEALEKAQAHLPHCILMDHILPGMSGPDTTRQLKAASDTGGIPIIMLSASSRSAFEEEAYAAGADDVEEKPVDFDRLSRKIEALTEGV
jgi:CheY-like chemotaxis protein